MMINKHGWLSWLAWLLAATLLGVAGYLGWMQFTLPAQNPQNDPKPTLITFDSSENNVELPVLGEIEAPISLRRKVKLNTLIPSRPRTKVIEYTVNLGDSVFAIAHFITGIDSCRKGKTNAGEDFSAFAR